MASLLSFDRLQRGWNVRRGLFEIILGTSLALYVDSDRNPRLIERLLPMFGTYLSECWPEKYPAVESDAFDYIAFDELEQYDQQALRSAVLTFRDDFYRGNLDRRIHFAPEARERIIAATDDLIALLNEAMPVVSR